MKTSRTVRKCTVYLGAALFSLGILLSPEMASAKGHPNNGNNRGHSDNGNHYGQYKQNYAPNPHWNNHPKRDYVYHRGHYGYWDKNPSGISIFINL